VKLEDNEEKTRSGQGKASPPDRARIAQKEPEGRVKIDGLVEAAEKMDWLQIVIHQKPPCFHLMPDGRFCGRSDIWPGHDPSTGFHDFFSLADLIRSVEKRR
jgi:hypothetical protein